MWGWGTWWRRRQRDADLQDGQRVSYSQLLEELANTVGPIGEALVEADDRRALHLFHFMTLLRPHLAAISELREGFQWLARVPGCEPELAHLCGLAADNMLAGLEQMLASADPRVLDQSRWLMETEFLFYEFARNPEAIGIWAGLPQHKRNQAFGFGALRRLREDHLGAPHGSVLADRDEYRVHSMAVHPRPSTDPVKEAPDVLSGLFYDAGDLIQHGWRAWQAAVTAVAETLADVEEATEPEPFPTLEAVKAAAQMTKDLHAQSGITGDRSEWIGLTDDLGADLRRRMTTD